MFKSILISTAAAWLFLAAAMPALARNTVDNYPIAGALKSGEGADKIDPQISLYFAGQDHPEVVSSLGNVATNKKTSALGVNDEFACQRAFLSALIQLQARAKLDGADAVIDIVSNYKNNERASATEFTCGAGALMAGVALKARLVKLQK
ncbi:Excinuclease ATPase subunit [Candidatus Burkholderia verschuerenii]|uniref:Excinuclease ATPase subunit n=1 Tax=Candidatus Burkholderia verschuerenii TaxID=242163 RepID=A0A0L0MI26_9BURK|nr:hypothetical protein [Candidatus Burkholderia verschuerenii]KND61950.1 Excinuclease ATPase subunit [Candidatus Burkholderia verschuerenii]